MRRASRIARLRNARVRRPSLAGRTSQNVAAAISTPVTMAAAAWIVANKEDGAKGIVNFLRHYSSHNKERRVLLQKLLRMGPDRIESVGPVDDEERTITNAAQVIRSFFAGMGITLESDQVEMIEDLVV